MQGFGFGRYRPPDQDPTKDSFNQGRHPLGARARKIDQGILVVRFELPFNIWCGGCNSHIGQGVRYNAEKKHVGDYYSTKIWAFRCKCHLCSHWFEVRTDPKNAQYVVHEGARRQVQDWNPEEHGGHPIFDDQAEAEAKAGRGGGGADAFSALEKRETQRSQVLRQTERILELEDHNSSRWSDPYALNKRLRGTFRAEKRKRTEQLERDVELRRRIGWNDDLPLASPRPADEEHERQAWNKAKRIAHRRSGTSQPAPSGSASASGSGSGSAADRLRNRLVANTRAKNDPFLQAMKRSLPPPPK